MVRGDADIELDCDNVCPSTEERWNGFLPLSIDDRTCSTTPCLLSFKSLRSVTHWESKYRFLRWLVVKTLCSYRSDNLSAPQ